MTFSRSFTTSVVLPLVIGLLLLNGALFYRSVNRMMASTIDLAQTARVERTLSEIKSALVDAETGQRGFLLTSDEQYLEPYRNAAPLVQSRLDELRSQAEPNGDLASSAARISSLAQEKLNEMAAVLAAHDKGGLTASRPLVAQGSGRAVMDQIRELIAKDRAIQADKILVQRGILANSKLMLQIAAAVFLLASVGLVAIVYLMTRREVLARSRAAAESERNAKTLDDNVKLLERERNEIAHLNESGNFLQSCNSVEEIGRMAGPLLQALFPNQSGALWIYAASRNQLSRLTVWGDGETLDHFAPDECWALRRGQAHVHHRGGATPGCTHLEHAPAESTICLPLVAHGETVGLMTVARAAALAPVGGVGAVDDAATMRLAEMAAGQLGLTLGNLKLRETLNQQSIRDPLTGAFNRRYLEAVAEKEFAIAKRLQRSFAVAMMDVDHFKRFNDVHGHAAGDAALVAITGYLRQNMREGDWLFRYGGEEFVLMFREAGAADAEAIAAKLGAGIAALPIKLGSEPLPSVTVSMGIAAYPRHGSTLDELTARADRALYESKRSGRNMVTNAEKLAA